MAVNVRFDAVTDLDDPARAELLGLLEQHFRGVSAEGFAADLAAKTHVLRLHDEGRLLGFSTIDYRRQGGEAVLYSGDTIVDPTAWEGTELGAAWVAAIFDLHASAGGGELWWLVLTSGVRTYRYLSVCVRRYAPAPADRLDPLAEDRLDALARERFGADYLAEAGIVRFSQPQALRGDLAVIPAHIAVDPAVAFFLARNPGWAAGDELVSCCCLDEDNLTATGRLALRRGRARLSGVTR